ncbi:MAG: AAA family ATPase [Blautia marasmi]
MIRGKTGERFIFVMMSGILFSMTIHSANDQFKFLCFLQNLLKSQAYVEMAYMTGILPIAKYSSGSPLNMFNEYTMADTGIARFSTCFGFTDREVMSYMKSILLK